MRTLVEIVRTTGHRYDQSRPLRSRGGEGDCERLPPEMTCHNAVRRPRETGPRLMLVSPTDFHRRKFAMKRKRFSTEQVVAALKQVELGLPVADLIRHSASLNRPTTDGRSPMQALNRIRCVSSDRLSKRIRG